MEHVTRDTLIADLLKIQEGSDHNGLPARIDWEAESFTQCGLCGVSAKIAHSSWQNGLQLDTCYRCQSAFNSYYLSEYARFGEPKRISLVELIGDDTAI